jgi:hypothetical protein
MEPISDQSQYDLTNASAPIVTTPWDEQGGQTMKAQIKKLNLKPNYRSLELLPFSQSRLG